MKKLAAIAALFGLLTAVGLAQDQKSLYSRPGVPTTEALNQLHLKLAWRSYLPVRGLRDGVNSVQVLGNQLLVQSRSGSLIAVDAATGDQLWALQIGLPYKGMHYVGYNAASIFIVNGTRMYAVDRRSGNLEWEYDLGTVPSAPPAADADRLYICLTGGQLAVYTLPKANVLDGGVPVVKKAPPPIDEPQSYDKTYSPHGVRGLRISSLGTRSMGDATRQRQTTGIHPVFAWNYLTDVRLEDTPIVTPEFVCLAGGRGVFMASTKAERKLIYHFQNEAPPSSPIGQLGDTAYLAAQDFNLYAINLRRGRIEWRFPANAPALRKPEVTDEDVYLSPDQGGLFRIDRSAGTEIWRNRDADRFLAMNPKYVYAMNRSGRLLILDRGRGRTLASYDMRDFVVPVTNELSDRVYLCANDGLLLCLHDQSYPKPLVNKTMIEAKKPQTKPPADAAPPEKPAEEKPPADKPKPAAKPPADKPKAEKPKAAEKDKEMEKK